MERVKRGDLVSVALNGDFGKPRPALVIQSDTFDEHATVTVLLVTSTLTDAPLIRVSIEPTLETGLRECSQIMVDKVMTVRREKIGSIIGHVDDATMINVNRSLALFLGFA